MKRVAAAFFITLAVTAGTASPSAAEPQKPQIFRFPIDDLAVTQGLCGFAVSIHTTGTAVVHVFPTDLWDERVIITAPSTRLTLTNIATGESVWTPSVNMVMQLPHEDGTGTKSLRGLFWRLVIPGRGLVAADVGKLDVLFTFNEAGEIVSEEVVFTAGQQDGTFLQEMCAALIS
jgi:hypothetical protein